MSVQEREYMGSRPDPGIDIENAEGVEAKSQQHAEKLLRFACPTQLADGRWYRTTIALTKVPVMELYNVLSNMNFIAQHLKEIAATAPADVAAAIQSKVIQIESLHKLLRQGDGDSSVFSGLNIHKAKSESDRKEDAIDT